MVNNEWTPHLAPREVMLKPFRSFHSHLTIHRSPFDQAARPITVNCVPDEVSTWSKVAPFASHTSRAI